MFVHRPLTRLVVSQQNDKMDDMPFLLEYCESGNELCSTLRVLNIANTGVTSAGVLLALRSAPELESLGEYCHMGRALEVIENASKSIEVPSFSLRIARSSRTSQHRLELLARACPNLHRLSLSEPHHSPENLSLLPTSLTSLNLHGVPNSSSWISKLYKFLEGPHGQNLRELTIRFFLPEFLTPLNVGSILQCCTNLQTFVLDGACVDWKLDSLPYLPLLEKIQLGKLVESQAVKNLMLSAPNLKTVHLHSCIDLEDQDLIKICNPNLECFYIYEASCISINTVNALLANCPNLQRLGHLNNWGLTCDTLYSVIKKIRDHNYNLEFNAGSHWFCSQCFSLNVHNI